MCTVRAGGRGPGAGGTRSGVGTAGPGWHRCRRYCHDTCSRGRGDRGLRAGGCLPGSAARVGRGVVAAGQPAGVGRAAGHGRTCQEVTDTAQQ